MKKIMVVLIVVLVCSGMLAMSYTPNKTAAPAGRAAAETTAVRGEETDWWFNGENPILEPQDSTFLFKSIAPIQSQAKEEDYLNANGFDGSFAIRVRSATLYDSPEQAGVSWDDLPAGRERLEGDFQSPVFLLLDVEMKNIDAVSACAAQFEQYANMFVLRDSADFLGEYRNDPYHIPESSDQITDLFYFSRHSDGEKDYYRFTLKTGETMDMQLGFFLEEDYALTHQLILALEHHNHFGIILQPAPARSMSAVRAAGEVRRPFRLEETGLDLDALISQMDESRKAALNDSDPPPEAIGCDVVTLRADMGAFDETWLGEMAYALSVRYEEDGRFRSMTVYCDPAAGELIGYAHAE